MKVEATTIEELIEKSGDQKQNMLFLDALVQEHAPNLSRRLFIGASITMIGYGEMPWQTKSSTESWPLISLAPQKGSTNLYIAGQKDGKGLLEIYASSLGKVSCGKSCVRVKKPENLNVEAFGELIKDAQHWLDLQEEK
ncbi:DUF1801 domain-containing protein [Flammeovirgaceae bacterium SG7u.111]|nr:DUF1801 domain-containing protein [Flammeovirgaceae bacterium SG7u.132]WPO33353.1 DUF1801 domain-containing protein [Flammeovirgaceae bacterium SG7u.111]